MIHLACLTLLLLSLGKMFSLDLSLLLAGLAIPPWVGAMSTGQRAVMLCDWGVKADMVLFAGNTV